jgi:hypothetical protein
MTGVGCVVGALAMAGCAAPGFDASKLQSELVHAGATVDQARCVTQGLTDTFDENQLGSHSAPTAQELTKTRAILSKCQIKLPLQPLR